MDTISFIRQQLDAAHRFLEGTLGAIGEDHAQWLPPGTANPVGATYAHVVVSEDIIVHGLLQQQAPLAASAWAGRTGLSEPMPMPDGNWEDYGPWARRVRLDLGPLREYAQAVYADTDAYLAGLTPAALDAPMDLTAMGLGQVTLGWVIGRLLLGHVDNITGELSALKGIQGLRGYPF
jgi:hypothetical protein